MRQAILAAILDLGTIERRLLALSCMPTNYSSHNIPIMNPHARSRLIEFHEQPYTPPAIRRPVQDMLTFAWTHRVWPLQHTSPAVLAGRVLESVLRRIGDEGKPVAVVDFCSGAGGPIPTIERVVK